MSEIILVDGKKVQEIIGENPLFVKKAVLESLRIHYGREFVQPPKQYLHRSADAHTADRIISMPVYIKDKAPVAGMKWIGSHPENFKIGLDRANALIIINNPTTNAPVAILSGSLISSMRTLAMSLIAIDRFKPSPKVIACLGMGKLGRLHAKFLPKLCPSVEKIFCFSGRANFDDLLKSPLIQKSVTYKDAISEAEVVITSTAVADPYISRQDIVGEKLMINLSLMDYELEVYLDADIIVVDDWVQCSNAKKVFKEGVDRGLIERSSVYELSELIFGENKHKTFSGKIMVNPIGMAVEDIVVSRAILKEIREDKSNLTMLN
jgi:ornithine cyclodeaminase